MTTPFLVSITGVYLVGFVVLAYLTRATPRRVLGALAGGLAVAVVGVGIEMFFFVIAWQMPNVIAFSPGLTIVLIDLVLWGGLTAFAQGIMRLVAGPAGADPLAPAHRWARRADSRS